MPIYDYRCAECRVSGTMMVPIAERDDQHCPVCDKPMSRLLAAPMGKMAGQVARGGGPDRFTADMLGVPLKELPKGLKTDE